MRSWVRNISMNRFFRSLLAISAALAMLAGCTSRGGTENPSNPPATASQAPVLALGVSFTTPIGNTVTAYAFDHSVTEGETPTPAPSGSIRVAAEVGICAGPNPTERTGANPSLFFIETQDRIAYKAVRSVKQPELEPTLLKANECSRGWATFLIPRNAKPVFILLISSQQVKWRIE